MTRDDRRPFEPVAIPGLEEAFWRERHGVDDRLTGYATANVTPVTAEETRALLDLGDRVRVALDPDTVTCPIRDCPGHEGPHGSMWAETWTAADDTAP